MIGVEVPEECRPPRAVVERIRAAAAKRARKAAKRLAERAKRTADSGSPRHHREKS